MKKWFYFLIILTITACNKDKKIDHLGDFSITNLTLGISFPPVENDSQRKKTASILSDLNVKKIRFSEEWKFREPTQNSFNWGPLDDRIDWASENNYEVLLTIQSNAPDWACSSTKNDNSCVFDTVAFKNYISLLLERYSGKISKIQFGNEWQSDFWYVGTAQEFFSATTILYQAVQTHSPSTKVVLGGFTTISLRYLAGCAGKIDEFKNDEGELFDKAFLNENCNGAEIQKVFDKIDYILTNSQYDFLDIHLYDDVENWGIYVDHFKLMTDKPIIVSEFGGPNSNHEESSQKFQAERVYKYIETLDKLEITEAYFFKLEEGSKNKAHKKSGLMKGIFDSKKRNYFIFKRFAN